MNTQSQKDRTELRGTDGRFTRNPCHLCGKGAPMDYYSDPRCNDVLNGRGLVLHKRCARKIASMNDIGAKMALGVIER